MGKPTRESDQNFAGLTAGRDANDGVAPRWFARHALGEWCNDEVFDRPAQRTCTELGIVTERCESRTCGGCELELEIARDEAGTCSQLVELEIDDSFEREGWKRPERDDRLCQ